MSYRPMLCSNRDSKTDLCLIASLFLIGLFVMTAMMPLATGQTEPAVEPENWYSMRNNQWNTGTSTGLAPDSEELYWIFEAPPHPVLGWTYWYGAVAVVNNIVYAGHANGNLYAIDESSGSVLWEFLVDDYAEDFPYPVLSSPAVDLARETIYLGADGLYAIDMNDGSLKWKFITIDDGFDYEWWSSPNFDEETVYFGSVSGFLFAIDADSGTEKWRFETGEREYNPTNDQEINKEAGGAITATPAIGPDYVYIVDWDENLFAVNKEDGELVFYQGFEDAFPGTQTPMEWGPIDMGAGSGYASVALDLDNHMMFIGDTSGNMWGLSMDSDDNGWDDDFDGRTDNEGKVEWKYTAGDLWSASASVYDNTVYAGSWDGLLYAFEPVTGQIKWQSPLHGTPFGSQVAADGMVYAPTYANEDGSWVGYTTAYDASGGDEVWNLRITDPFLSQPAVYNDKIILGDWFGAHLIAIGVDGPKPDLFVADVSATDDMDGERYIYAAVCNKAGTIISPPFDIQIFVDGKMEHNESFGSLNPGEYASATIKSSMGGGSHDIKAKVIQRPTGWYHIEEVNEGNNDMEITVGGIAGFFAGESSAASPLMFLLGLLIGAGTAWLMAGREKEEDGPRQPIAHLEEQGVDQHHDIEEGKFITSQNAKRYHRSRCPFAINIPRNGGTIVTLEQALSMGKKPCKCTEITTDKDTEAEALVKEEPILDAEQG